MAMLEDDLAGQPPVRLLVAAELGVDAPDGAEVPDSTSTDIQQRVLGHLAAPGTPEWTVHKAALLATGKLGNPAPGNKGTRAHMQELLDAQQHHGLLMIGGLSMAAGQAARWDDFLHQMQPVLTRVPLAAAPSKVESAGPQIPWPANFGSGNNTSSSSSSGASGGECGMPYEELLRMPQAVQFDQWYSLNMGPVHMVMLSTEQRLDRDSPQYK